MIKHKDNLKKFGYIGICDFSNALCIGYDPCDKCSRIYIKRFCSSKLDGR